MRESLNYWPFWNYREHECERYFYFFLGGGGRGEVEEERVSLNCNAICKRSKYDEIV